MSKNSSPIQDATLDATLLEGKRCTKELVAARIKAFRENRSLTQEAAAAKARGMPLPSYKDYEGGRRLPGAEALDSLAELGMNINWVLTGKGDMNSSSAPEVAVAKESSPAAYGMSQAPVDSLLLQDVIDFFHVWLEQNKDRTRIQRSAHGAVIAVLYRYASQTGKVEKAELEQVLRIAA